MLCACRSGQLWLRLLVLALAVLLALAGWSAGDPLRSEPVLNTEQGGVTKGVAVESTRALEQRALSRGAIVVAYGTEMDLEEAGAFFDALEVFACDGIEASVREEVKALREALRGELVRHLASETDRILASLDEARLAEALTRAAREEGPCVIWQDEFAVEVGFQMYRYWAVDREAQSRAKPVIGLPPTRQAYVRLLLRMPRVRF